MWKYNTHYSICILSLIRIVLLGFSLIRIILSAFWGLIRITYHHPSFIRIKQTIKHFIAYYTDQLFHVHFLQYVLLTIGILQYVFFI